MVRMILVIALTIGAAANAQQAVPVIRPGETLLQVSATGTIKAVPDVAELSVAVSSDGATAKQALADTSVVASRMIGALRAMGVPLAAIKTEALSVHPRHKRDKDGDDTNDVTGFRAQDRLKVTLRDVSKAGAVVDALTSAGATDIDGPAFLFGDEVPLRARARAAAVRQVQQQANDYASPLGLKVIRPLRISERSVDTSGGNDIIVTGTRRGFVPALQPGEREVRVTVWGDYALAPQ